MNKGRFLAIVLGAITIALVVIGTVWPAPSAAAYAGAQSMLASSSTAEDAVRHLGDEVRGQAWARAEARLGDMAASPMGGPSDNLMTPERFGRAPKMR